MYAGRSGVGCRIVDGVGPRYEVRWCGVSTRSIRQTAPGARLDKEEALGPSVEGRRMLCCCRKFNFTIEDNKFSQQIHYYIYLLNKTQ